VAAATGVSLFFGLLMVVPFAAGGSTFCVRVTGFLLSDDVKRQAHRRANGSNPRREMHPRFVDPLHVSLFPHPVLESSQQASAGSPSKPEVEYNAARTKRR
jgi:hypothetical protein